MIKIILNIVLCIIPLFLYSQTQKLNQYSTDKTSWWKQNQFKDSVASISWNSAIEYLVKKNEFPQGRVTVAVIDSEFDLNHRILKNVMWVNEDEIKDNNVDDDSNGYIDDYFGWNFLGIKKKDSALGYVLMEKTRILRTMDSISFKNIRKKNKIPFSYTEVRSSYDSTVDSLKADIKYYRDIEKSYTYVMDTLKKLISNKITLKNLSSFKTTNDTIKGYVDFAKYYYEDDYFPYEKFMEYLYFKEQGLKICMNLDYDNRILIEDQLYNIRDVNYGNNFFGKNISILEHGTSVSGVIAHSMLDSTSSKSKIFSNKFPTKIIPITFTGVGDFTDKDFYLAIKYAVNNGAKIINLSQAKDFSIQPKLLKKALSYAERKNVLIVLSAGNQALNLDKQFLFPHSIPRIFNKQYSNLIIVGANTKKIGENLVDGDTNYGLKSVDIFAPGIDILTCLPNGGYGEESGTSFAAPLVANVAALIWSHYPKLKACQIKDIILNSGSAYNGLVNVPYNSEIKSDEKKFIAKQPFQNLSKSGKILNAYNAIIMAEKIASN